MGKFDAREEIPHHWTIFTRLCLAWAILLTHGLSNRASQSSQSWKTSFFPLLILSLLIWIGKKIYSFWSSRAVEQGSKARDFRVFWRLRFPVHFSSVEKSISILLHSGSWGEFAGDDVRLNLGLRFLECLFEKKWQMEQSLIIRFLALKGLKAKDIQTELE